MHSTAMFWMPMTSTETTTDFPLAACRYPPATATAARTYANVTYSPVPTAARYTAVSVPAAPHPQHSGTTSSTPTGVTSNTSMNTPPQRNVGVPHTLSSSILSTTPPAHSMEGTPVYFFNPAALPVGYAPMLSGHYNLAPSANALHGAPLAAFPIQGTLSNGGSADTGALMYTMSGTGAFFPSPSGMQGSPNGTTLGTASAGAFFVPPQLSPSLRHGNVANNNGGQAFSGAYMAPNPPVAIAGMQDTPLGGNFSAPWMHACRSSGNTAASLEPAKVQRNGDAGRGYEAGAYYEGRVKRFNPMRGYGFLSATHRLLRLADVLTTRAAAQASSGAKFGTECAQLKTPGTPISPTEVDRGDTSMITALPVETEHAIVVGKDDDDGVDLSDVVVIKGEDYVRKPVVMGDIFVHYHCLRRTKEELAQEANDVNALVNLPAGARVQFRAEVFVPARLMEEAHDNTEAAAMLNKLGVPVDADRNLLAGAITTKKGWGYQAMNVVLLPNTPPPQQHNASSSAKSRHRHRGSGSRGCWEVGTRDPSAHSSSLYSSSSRQTSSVLDHPKEDWETDKILAPCSGKHLNIRVPMTAVEAPPPSFEVATASLHYSVMPGGMPREAGASAAGYYYFPAFPSHPQP